MILDVHPEPDDLRATLRRHIDFPAVPGSAKANGPRLDRDACGGTTFPGASDAPPSSNAFPSSGRREGAPGFSLEDGRVWDRPACVARMLRRDRLRHALIVFAVALVLAGAAFTLVMALVAPNVGR